MHSPYVPFTPHHTMAPYHSVPRVSRSKLSDNIMTDAKGAFTNPDITLLMRQEPVEALVLSSGKEKNRKPVDPPPIVELKVNEDVEASHHFLQSPHLFVVTDLWKSDKDERWDEHGSSLYGALCSSLHRLKDISNKDGGFFIFGDISVRVTGTFRLQFNLYDLQREQNAAVFLGSVLSRPFKVMAAKDFQGLAESTYMSRTFADQGVRLRLRKEPRAFAGQKRPYYDEESRQNKRYRPETEENISTTAPQTAVQTSTHAPTLSADYTSSHTTGLSQDYTSPHAANIQPDYAAPYPTSLQPSYSAQFARLPQPYPAQYISQPSPYYQARHSIDARPYPVGQYPNNLNMGNMPPSSLPQSTIPPSTMSQTNVPQYQDDPWTVPEQVPANWQHQPSSSS